MQVYAGIGSRETPDDVLLLMRQVAQVLGQQGWLLHSGGAEGADVAFELGARDVNAPRRIYVPGPHKAFGPLLRHDDPFTVVPMKDFGTVIWSQAKLLGSDFHPGWKSLSNDSGPMRLLTRNGFQILGDNLETPVDRVICYGSKPVLREGRCVDVAGGTGQAVRIASEYVIPVTNLAIEEHRLELEAWLGQQTVPVPVSTGRPDASSPERGRRLVL